MIPKAPPGKVIVRFHKYRREGTIVVPDRYAPQPVECTIISDSKGEWDGKLAIASLMDGIYIEVDRVEYCVLKRKSMLLFYTEGADGKIATVRPVARAVITTDPGRVEKQGRFFTPENENRFPPFGKVICMGPGQWDFNPGDTIHFDRSKAIVLGIDGKRALLIYEEHIYAMEEAA